jgi:hypothetical protein
MNHDELSELYQTDPDAFEVRRQEMIEDFITTLPEEKQTAMRQLQWRIDGELSKYKDPIARMNKMVELFWEGFAELNKALNELPEKLDEFADELKGLEKASRVLTFPSS